MSRKRTLRDLIGRLGSGGDRDALVSMLEQRQDTWSYGRLHEEVLAFAGGLRENGIQPGTRVAILAETGPRWVAASLGIIHAGAVVVPLDVQIEDRDLQHVLQDSEPELICTKSAHRERIREAFPTREPQYVLFDGPDGPSDGWKQWLGSALTDPPTVDPGDTATLFYTSGTTGPPKGVPLTHRNVHFELEAIVESNLVESDDRVLQPLPLHHVYPFVVGTLAPLRLGLTLVYPVERTGPELVRALVEGRVTLLLGVPRLYRALQEGIHSHIDDLRFPLNRMLRVALTLCGWLTAYLGFPAGKWLLRPLHARFGPRLRVLVSGGAALDPGLARGLEAFGWQVATGYGLTETSPILTLNPPGEGRLETAGRPLPGVEVRIDEDKANPGEGEGEGARGEVLARGPNVFHGYRNLPEKTREVLDDDGWFRTGELGYVDPDGYLHLLGRVSTMIVTESGENIQPDQVEEVYLGHPCIEEIGVLKREGQLVAVVVPDLEECRQRGEGSIQAAIRSAIQLQSKQLASYKRLSDFAITRDPLPRTRLGDLRRHLLPERYEQARGKTASKSTPAVEISDLPEQDRELLRDPDLRRVWEWLRERYPERGLSPDSSLQIDLGIDSMEWVNLTMEIGRRTGVQIDEKAISRLETVRDLLLEIQSEIGKSDSGASGVSPLEAPERVLDENQQRWLEPLSPPMRVLARSVYHLNRGLVRTWLSPEARNVGAVPEGVCVLAPNHLSYLDPFVLASVLDYERMKDLSWAAWTGQAFANPLTRLLSRLARAIPIDPAEATVSSLAFGAAVLKRGDGLIWFPEGRRSLTGELQPFQLGLGLLLDHYRVPVVPVFIQGTYEVLPPGRRIPRRAPVRVVFGDPVATDVLEEGGSGDRPETRIMNGLRERVLSLQSQLNSGSARQPEEGT